MRIKTFGLMILAVAITGALLGTPLSFGQDAPAEPAVEADAPKAVEPGCKVGFVNLARVLDESQAGKDMKKSLDAEKDKAFAPLKARSAELEQLEQEISELTQEIIQKSQIWDQQTRLYKQQELQNLQIRYQNIIQQLQLDKGRIQDELNKKKDEMLKPLEDELNEIMKKIGEEGGYCLVLDVMPPSPINPILYYNQDLDITDQLIQAVDK